MSLNKYQQKVVQTARYQSAQKQTLRGVHLYTPTIIWVAQGQKRLWWRDKELIFTPSNWLIIPANQQLVFINQPNVNGYLARSLSFLYPPPLEWIASSAAKSNVAEPRISISASLAYCFDMLYEMENKHLAIETQKQLLRGFYAELQNVAVLHLLFPHCGESLTERLAQFLRFSPGEDHKLETVAAHFSMSRSTFIRKLGSEGSAFRQVLTNVRMHYSLELIQQSNTLLSIALSCGYQSEVRFSKRFKQTFGLTPRRYFRTL